jgi:hypothetical protein
VLQCWQSIPGQEGLRDPPPAMAKLPAAEQEACKQLWVEVAELVKQADNK